MIYIFRNKRQVFIGFLFLLSALPLLVSLTKKKENIADISRSELFNPALIRLNSVHKISDFIDSVYCKTSKSQILDTSIYVKISSDIIKNRFYHGLSNYSLNDNWIAYLAGKLFWNHLYAIVDPDDILDYSEGLCSQQTIVFLEILKRKGIKTRCIGLGYQEGPGHFLSELHYAGSWHLHDVTIEPKWERIASHHQSISYYQLNQDSLFLAYEGIISKPVFNKIMTKVKYGAVNEFPAKNMLLFHRITKIITYLIPIFFGIIILITLFKQRVSPKIIKNTFSKINGKEKELELTE